MRRIFLLFVLVIGLVVGANAQTVQSFVTDSVTISQYRYCEIVGTSGLFSTKVTIRIDYGQSTKFWTQWRDTQYIDPDTGKPIEFNSMIDAMNFMGKNGWEFVQAYIIGSNQTGYVYHYVLKKYVSIK